MMEKTGCPACRAKKAAEKECPVCGMANIFIPGTGEEGMKIVTKYADQYREKLLSELEIGVYARTYRVEGDHYAENGKEYVRLFSGSQLSFDQTIWADEVFGQSREDQNSEVELVIRRNGKESAKVLHYRTPELQDLWRVGICLLDELKVALVIGNETCFSPTEAVSVLI